jgi:phosphoribosyl-AMP cyclohydrolase|tara:strand:+ start:316641 stop:317054 length:414 start_codon:yes stop_codon:yes gene_type:complete
MEAHMTDYSPPLSGSAQDETRELRPKFNADGLIAAIAQDATSGEVLMLAWMNAEALAATLATGRATYWSRSRGELWVKGDTSGHIQEVVEVRVDCDQDAVLLRVNQTGGACHTGRDSCFYRVIDPDGHALSLDTKNT